MNFKKLLLAATILFCCGIYAQELFPPVEVIHGTFIKTTIPLRDFPTIKDDFNSDPKTMTIVSNKSRYNAKVNEDALPYGDVDHKVQSTFGGITAYALEQNFIGFDDTDVTPPDPTGAVGPNHYVHAVNSQIKIFDKSGNLLAGPIDLGPFLDNPEDSYDPIVLYDHLADRYFISGFGPSSSPLAMAVSVTNDPTGAYYVYQYLLDSYPDYPKYSIWPDGYYVTANKQGTNKVYAIEREVMLAGGTNPQIVGFPLPGSVETPNNDFSPEPANLIGTLFPADVPGYIVYFQDDGWEGVSFDHLKVWEIDVDWGNIGNSTISSALEIPTDPFNSVFAPPGTGDVNQPGTNQKISIMDGIISFAANYRSFGTHNSWVITFNTDIDGNDTSGVRWIELRNDDINPWEIYQEGTYAPADGHSRFMGSAAMDALGNIGLGFNIASATLPVGIRYTGRFDGDPLGEMTLAESTIVDGVGVQTTSYRFGDYSHLTIDPDNFTFWYTAEYFSANNQWRTQIASFSLSGGFATDVAVNNIINPTNGILTNAEEIKISIRNFGTAIQSNIPVELRVDGNLIASEVFEGTINGNETASYTFSQTVNLSNEGQTYSIEAKTNLGGDEYISNDKFTKEVTHLLSNDVGALAVTAPESGDALGMETIAVTINNFGGLAQSNFNVQYVIDGGSPVIETFVGPITSEEEVTYIFTQQGDFTGTGNHELVVTTLLTGDQDTSNDEISVIVENIICQPEMDCSSGNGIRHFVVAGISNPSGCEGYADFTNWTANLAQGSTNDIIVITNNGDQNVKVWIDFNDDSIFTNDEVVVPNFVIAPGEGEGSHYGFADLIIPTNATVGSHRMRVKSNWQAPVPEDACEETTYGETEDYTANIETLGVHDFEISNSELIITNQENNHFEITLVSNYEGKAYVAVYNMLGQQLGYKIISKVGNSYTMSLDMSQANSGVYLVKVGKQDNNSIKTGRIIVK